MNKILLKLSKIMVLAAVLTEAKQVLAGLPNCELVTTLIIALTLQYGIEMYAVVTLFTGYQVLLYGIGSWVLMYLYVWPVLVTVTLLLKKVIKDDITWSIVAGMFGLMFGLLCSFVYVPISVSYAISWWEMGLMWDAVHGLCNFGLTMVSIVPIRKFLQEGIPAIKRRVTGVMVRSKY